MTTNACLNIPHRWRSFVQPDETGELLVCSRCGTIAFIDKRQSNKLHRWFRKGLRWPQITVVPLVEEKP